MAQNKIKTISITKTEFELIKDSLLQTDTYNNKYSKCNNYEKLIDKFSELSPHFEYSIKPIMYDEY